MKAKAKVNQEVCIGCGMCIEMCPEVFKYNDDDKSEAVGEVSNEDLKDKVLDAQEVCPVDAIEVDE